MRKSAPILNQSYLISVSYCTGCYRHIRLSTQETLLRLSNAILDAFSFDDDHMHEFFMENRLWDPENSFISEVTMKGERSTEDAILSNLQLVPGKQFKYLFDFGDEWIFQCKVLRILDEPTIHAVTVKSVGDAPRQYSYYDEDEEGQTNE